MLAKFFKGMAENMADFFYFDKEVHGYKSSVYKDRLTQRFEALREQRNNLDGVIQPQAIAPLWEKYGTIEAIAKANPAEIAHLFTARRSNLGQGQSRIVSPLEVAEKALASIRDQIESFDKIEAKIANYEEAYQMDSILAKEISSLKKHYKQTHSFYPAPNETDTWDKPSATSAATLLTPIR